jgi:hypothetical protein
VICANMCKLSMPLGLNKDGFRYRSLGSGLQLTWKRRQATD